jgi:hypothetical protein
MYNIASNGLVATIMRWPILGGIISGITAINTTGWISSIAIFIAGSTIGAYALSKYFKNMLCDCENYDFVDKISWVVEHSPETGAERPWDVYSMFAGNESTKQHYASYATEESALNKIAKLKDILITKEK